MTTALATTPDPAADLAEFEERAGAALAYLKSMAGPVVTRDVLGTLANQVADWREKLGVTVGDVAVAVRRMIHPDRLGELRFAADVVATFAKLVGSARRERLEREERLRQAEYLRAAPETDEERAGRERALDILRAWMRTTHLPGGDRGDEEEAGRAAGYGDEG